MYSFYRKYQTFYSLYKRLHTSIPFYDLLGKSMLFRHKIRYWLPKLGTGVESDYKQA